MLPLPHSPFCKHLLEDFFGIEENNDYERVWIRDADHPEIAGWVYVWAETRGLPYADGDWWPEVWKRKKQGRTES